MNLRSPIMLCFRSLLVGLLAAPPLVLAQPQSLSLDSLAGLTLHNARGEIVVFEGRRALRLAAESPATERTGTNAATGEAQRQDHLAIVEGVDFSSGTIEVELAGHPAPGATGGARGFVGIAFRVQPDKRTYDCFYLRPTNGRAEDQERRNHSAQYVSHPDHTWSVLREKFPSRYESYVDITPGAWIRVKIVVDGEKARLFVNDAKQPILIVNDLKTGGTAKGAVALWFEGSTVAHFANLRISPR